MGRELRNCRARALLRAISSSLVLPAMVTTRRDRQRVSSSCRDGSHPAVRCARDGGNVCAVPTSVPPESAVPDWLPGHAIYFGPRTLRVVGVRDDDADQPPVLIVEEASWRLD